MKKDLHSRLDALSAQIDKARGELKQHEKWTDGHRLTAGELEARHRYLKHELDQEVRDLEAHGERVTDLEVSVRKWIDGLFLKAE